jgi:ethanolamine permease
MVVYVVAGEDDSESVIGGTLLNMAVFGAMLSYGLQAMSFILLRKNFPNINRPYRSPLGVPGAAVTLIIALVTLYQQLTDPIYRAGVYWAAAWYALGILYFAVHGRHTLVFSPEEEFAVRHRASAGIDRA